MPIRSYTYVTGTTDPLNQTGTPVRQVTPIDNNAESVISRYHPHNNRPHDDGRNSTYTFRQRQTKLNLTLGWELEANHAPSRIPAGVAHISDGSVDGDGAEFVVLPAVTKSPRYVLGLLKDLVHAPRLNTNESCGFHVHVSASNLSSIARMRQWAIATEHLALQVEDLAFKAVPAARQGNSYCRRIVPISHGTSFQSHKYNNNRRYHWLNIVEMFRPGGIRTIEVRLLGNTHRWKYVLAWSLFSMELARRGWDVANKPFEVAGHVDALSRLLVNIAKEVKPLEKKLEPIPQWIYEGLKTFGIEPNAWERPLARLSETEAEVQNLPRRFYSDNQEIEGTHNDDECDCGCGTDGRCDTQIHSDSDCDSAYCDYCHEDGNCPGSPRCERCRENRHDEGEDCERNTCTICHPTRRVVPPAPSVPVNPSPVTASTNVEIHPSNEAERRQGVLSAEAMRLAMEQLRDRPIEPAPDFYGRGIAESLLTGVGFSPVVRHDESVNSPLQMAAYLVYDPVAWGQTVEPTYETERQAESLLDVHELALSLDRQAFDGHQRRI